MYQDFDVDKIARMLPNLSTAELTELRSRITALLAIGGGKGASNSKEDGDEKWMLDCIASVLSSLGVEQVTSHALSRTSEMGGFRRKITPLLNYLSKAGNTRNQKYAILAVGVELLYINLLEMGVPISPITVLRHIHRIPAVIENSFPGYARNGLLGLIIKAEKNNNVRSKQSQRTHAGERRIADHQ